MAKLPEQLRKTLTWDRGKELSAHAQFMLESGTKVFFADPHSPWQRPTNENTNGLLRQYFPKGTDLSRWSFEDLEAVALAVNNRPRKALGWRTDCVDQKQQRLCTSSRNICGSIDSEMSMRFSNSPTPDPSRNGASQM